jgi:protein TonB
MTMISSGDPVPDVLRHLARDRVWIRAMLVVAACMHAVVAWALPRHPSPRSPRHAPIQVVDVDLPAPPPSPAVVAAPQPPRPENERQPASRRALAASPAPARAAAVLARQDHRREPLDLTDDGFVTGSASTYDGGATATRGVGPTGPAGGAPDRSSMPAAPRTPPSSALGPDRSRRPAVMGGVEWRCPFPSEADAMDIDSAVATIRVDLDASGTIRSVSIQSDPGHGFGREAKRCASTKAWMPALDRDGQPVDGTAVVNVRFVR